MVFRYTDWQCSVHDLLLLLSRLRNTTDEKHTEWVIHFNFEIIYQPSISPRVKSSPAHVSNVFALLYLLMSEDLHHFLLFRRTQQAVTHRGTLSQGVRDSSSLSKKVQLNIKGVGRAVGVELNFRLEFARNQEAESQQFVLD